VRPALFVAAAVAIAAIVPADALRGALATAASALLEAAPFLFAARAIARIAGARPGIAAYLGCGCGPGPTARSLPAAAATWLVFGPAVAAARVLAATLLARLPHVRARETAACAHGGALDDLAAMAAPALLAGIASQLVPFAGAARANPFAAIAAGAALGFAAAPCALGGVALAGALHARAPLMAASFLCVAGVLDARTLLPPRERAHGDDAFAYLLAALALAIVALRRGGALVHPAAAVPLGLCAAACGALLLRHRRARNPAARLAPALMLAGALAAAPAPAYYATETTLAGAFPGERVSFTGTLARDRRYDALVRYAILCCRADAAPVVLRLANRLPYPAGTWVRAEGVMRAAGAALVFAPHRIERTAPPEDPFVYR
jgi:hypothetical protein